MQPDGKRLAKREGTWTIEGLRAGGWSAERIIGVMAKWSGFGDGSAMSVGEFAAQFSLEKMSRVATVVEPL
jgi:glutamyl-tRNA synthetase